MSAVDHRGHVGPSQFYDVLGARQFGLLTCILGLREHHYLLDIGCGSLRGGRFFMLYLQPGHYFGIEPEVNVLSAGIAHEASAGLVEHRQPTFSHDRNFTLTAFGRPFDYILAQSIFTHAARGQIERCMSEAAKVMHTSSVFAATVFFGETSYAGTSWAYGGANPMKAQYQRDHLLEMADNAGLTMEDVKSWEHLAGSAQRWVVFRKKPSE